MSLQSTIEALLRERFRPTHLAVVDESHRHAGHAGAGGGGHFVATIVSEAFEGRSRLDRQRMVFEVVGELMRSGAIHALAMTTRTPAEWAAEPR